MNERGGLPDGQPLAPTKTPVEEPRDGDGRPVLTNYGGTTFVGRQQSTLARSDEALLSKSVTKGPDLGCKYPGAPEHWL